MKSCVSFLAMIATCLISVGQQTSSGNALPEFITVRMLNGKTGKPVRNQTINLWQGDARSPLLPTTNAEGEVHFPISSSLARTLRYLPANAADCRLKEATPAGMNWDLSLDEIISKGIVAENLCGKIRIQPVPGTLIIFVRNFTFMEKWRS